LVSIEVKKAAEKMNKAPSSEAVGATNSYSNEQCRLRWSYIHLTRKTGRQISYEPAELDRERMTFEAQLSMHGKGKENKQNARNRQPGSEESTPKSKKEKKSGTKAPKPATYMA